MDFLKLADKRIIVFGLANRKSVACAIAKVLQEAGAEVVHVVRSDVRKETAEKLFPAARVFVCDVENEENIARVKKEVEEKIPDVESHLKVTQDTFGFKTKQLEELIVAFKAEKEEVLSKAGQLKKLTKQYQSKQKEFKKILDCDWLIFTVRLMVTVTESVP